MVPTKNSNFLGIVAGLATIYLIWGSTYLAIRVAVVSIPPFMMGGSRFLIAGVTMAMVLWFFRGFALTRRQWLDSAIIAAFMLLGGNGLVCWAEVSIPSGVATLIVALNPIFFVLAEWFIAWKSAKASHESNEVEKSASASNGGTEANRPKPLTFAGLALGSMGLFILVGPSFGKDSSSPLSIWPVLAVIMACLCWTIGSLYGKYTKNAADPFVGSAAQMICGGVELMIMSAVIGEPQSFAPMDMTTSSLLAWLYLVIAGSLVAFTTFVWLMKHSSSTLVSTYAYVNPMVAVFLGWLLLGEPLSFNLVFASAFIIGGVALISLSKNRKQSTKATK